MENTFLYFISDYFLILGIALSLVALIFAKNESPKLGFNILVTTLVLAILGYVPFFCGMLKLTGLFDILQNYISFTPFNDFGAMFLNSSIVITPFNILFKFLITTCALITALLSYGFIKGLNQKTINFTLLFLLGTLGGNLTAVSNDFITLLISLEIISVAVCFIISMFNTKKDVPEIIGKTSKIPKDAVCLEAGVKAFISNAISLSLMLLGVGIIYLYIGSLNFYDMNLIAINGKVPASVLLNLGEILFFMGLMCKICAFPFHIFVLDIFKGANYPTGLFISTVGQVAGFAAVIKILSVLGYINSILNFALVLCALLTLLIGAFVLHRTTRKTGEIKNFLAANAILNAGYVFLGISFLTKSAINAALFCLIIFAITTFGLYAACMLIVQNINKNAKIKEEDNGNKENLLTLRGLSYISPFFSTILSLHLLSFAGLPFMAGFCAKFYLFTEILRVGVRAVYPLIFAAFAGVIVFWCCVKILYLIFSRPNYHHIKNAIFKKTSLFNKFNIYTFFASLCAIMLFLGFFFGGYLMNLIEKMI